MAPPPKPPIICYDLQTNANARRMTCANYRVPSTSASRKTKVTIVQRDQNELDKARACWDQNIYYISQHSRIERDGIENTKQSTSRHYIDPYTERRNQTKDRIIRVDTGSHASSAVKPYLFTTNPFSLGDLDGEDKKLSQSRVNNAARHAYGQKLKQEAEAREQRLERKRRHLAMQAQLEEIRAQLEASKRIQENLLKSFGMSHNAAKYIQIQDENYAKLRQKVDQFAQTRSKELGRRVQQMKKIQEYQQHEDKKVEERRLRDMSKSSAHNRRTLSSTLNNSLSSNSLETNSVITNAENSSSTISITSDLSSLSNDDFMPSVHFIESPPSKSITPSQATPPISSSLTSSIDLSTRHGNNCRISKISLKPQEEKFSFYKGNHENEILEITDMAFMEKIEDKSMLEVNELMKHLQSALNESKYDLDLYERSRATYR